MNILIIELGKSHIECTYTFVYLLSLQKKDIHLICNSELYPDFPMKNKLKGYALMPNSFTLLSTISTIIRIRQYIKKNKIEYIIFNTTEIKIIRNIFIFLPNQINFFGLVHNARKIETGSSVKKIFSKRMKKYFLIGNHLVKKTNTYQGLSAYPYFPIYFPLPAKKHIHKEIDDIWVTIVGGVNLDRRDYIQLLELIKGNKFRKSIKFIFLGKLYYSDQINAEICNQNWWKESIISFSDHVDYDLFHNYLANTDIILPLIKFESENTFFDQRISGSFNVGLGYKIPFLLPDSYQNIDIKPFSISYASYDQLCDILNEISANNKTLDQVRSQYDTSLLFNFEEESKKITRYIEGN